MWNHPKKFSGGRNLIILPDFHQCQCWEKKKQHCFILYQWTIRLITNRFSWWIFDTERKQRIFFNIFSFFFTWNCSTLLFLSIIRMYSVEFLENSFLFFDLFHWTNRPDSTTDLVNSIDWSSIDFLKKKKWKIINKNHSKTNFAHRIERQWQVRITRNVLLDGGWGAAARWRRTVTSFTRWNKVSNRWRPWLTELLLTLTREFNLFNCCNNCLAEVEVGVFLDEWNSKLNVGYLLRVERVTFSTSVRVLKSLSRM